MAAEVATEGQGAGSHAQNLGENDEELGEGRAEEEDPSTTPWALNQQRTFNEKAKMLADSLYSPAHVTARLRALISEVINFHSASSSSIAPPSSSNSNRVFYPLSGDTLGYGEDLTLNFRARISAMREVLRRDKRVVMDVLEGRGVRGFVGSPWGYHKRKDSNNGCNEKKKRVAARGMLMGMGEEDEDGDGEGGRGKKTRGRGKGRRGGREGSLLRVVRNVDDGDDGIGDTGDEDITPGSSRVGTRSRRSGLRSSRRRRGVGGRDAADDDDDDAEYVDDNDDLGGFGRYFR